MKNTLLTCLVLLWACVTDASAQSSEWELEKIAEDTYGVTCNLTGWQPSLYVPEKLQSVTAFGEEYCKQDLVNELISIIEDAEKFDSEQDGETTSMLRTKKADVINNELYSILSSNASKETIDDVEYFVYPQPEINDCPVSVICNYAFDDWNLTIGTLYIYDNITTIAQNAFWDVTVYDLIIYSDNPPEVGSLEGVQCIWVPIDAYYDYINDYNWAEHKDKIVNENVTYPEFYDDEFHSIAVQQWDTNGDGNVDEEELDEVTDIGEVFKNSLITSIEDLALFPSVTAIPDAAFSNCDNLVNITIPDNITSIGEDAFYNCVNLKQVAFGNSLHYIGPFAFQNCSITNLELPASVNYIGKAAFADNEIGELPDISGMSFIADSLFCDNRITDIILPEGCTTIGSHAFSTGKVLVSSIHLPKSLNIIGEAAFGSLAGVTDLSLHPDNTTFTDNGTMILTDDNTTIVLSRPTASSLALPADIATIKGGAFWGVPLSQILLPSYLKKIGRAAFRDNRLSRVTIPYQVEEIGEGNFGENTDIIYIGDIPSVLRNLDGHLHDNLYVKSSVLANARKYCPSFNVSDKIPFFAEAPLMTFCKDYDADFSNASQLSCWTISEFDMDEKTVEMEQMPHGYIPARSGKDNMQFVGAIIKCDGPLDKTYYYKIGEQPMWQDNILGDTVVWGGEAYLIGCVMDTTIEPQTQDPDVEWLSFINYIFNTSGTGKGLSEALYKVSMTGTVPAGKAYVRLPQVDEELKDEMMKQDVETFAVRWTKANDSIAHHDNPAAKAADTNENLVMIVRTPEQEFVILPDRGAVIFTGNQTTITGEQPATIPTNDIRQIYFKTLTQNSIEHRFADNTVVTVTDLAGRTVYRGRSIKDAALKKGCYIVTANGESKKITINH